MRPEKVTQPDSNDKFTAIGVPEEWVEHIREMGYITVNILRKEDSAGKLSQSLNGYRKKNKLDISGSQPRTGAVVVE